MEKAHAAYANEETWNFFYVCRRTDPTRPKPYFQELEAFAACESFISKE